MVTFLYFFSITWIFSFKFWTFFFLKKWKLVDIYLCGFVENFFGLNSKLYVDYIIYGLVWTDTYTYFYSIFNRKGLF